MPHTDSSLSGKLHRSGIYDVLISLASHSVKFQILRKWPTHELLQVQSAEDRRLSSVEEVVSYYGLIKTLNGFHLINNVSPVTNFAVTQQQVPRETKPSVLKANEIQSKVI